MLPSVASSQWVDIIRGYYLQTGGRAWWLIDENDGAGRTGRVDDLGSGVRSARGAGRDDARREHDEAIGPDGDVEISSVDAEVHAGDERCDGREPLTRGNEIDIHSAGPYGLVNKAKSNVTGGCGLSLIGKGDLLETGGGITDQNRILAGGGKDGLRGREHLPSTGSIGGDVVGAWGELDVGGNGAEVQVEREGVGVLIEIEPGSVGRRVNDANMRFRSGTEDGLAARERPKRRDGRNKASGWTSEMEGPGRHGRP